jgi:sugar (pentulose or hexulose) kinase
MTAYVQDDIATAGADALLAEATQFTLRALPADHPASDFHAVVVSARGHGLWAVYSRGTVLTRDGRWMFDRETALRIGRELLPEIRAQYDRVQAG